MAEPGIARARFFVGFLCVAVKGVIIGAGITFALGLNVILVCGVIFASPGAVIPFMAEYPLILLLLVLSCVAGIFIAVWRVYSYQKKDCWSLHVVPRMTTDKYQHHFCHRNRDHADAAVLLSGPSEKQSTSIKGRSV
jgi:hypothetical protein